jgi:hypothetical protein
MRFNAFIQTFVPVAFGLGFVVFGMVAFIRMGNSQQQFEGKLQSIQAGRIQPDMLLVITKYVDHGRGAWPHVVFSSNRQPRVDIAATVDFFNSVNLGDTIPGYYFPDGYFVPQNHKGDAGSGKWFILGLGVFLGGGALALAFASARTKRPNVDIDALRTMLRDKMDGQ